jgi:hypothetical protein
MATILELNRLKAVLRVDDDIKFIITKTVYKNTNSMRRFERMETKNGMMYFSRVFTRLMEEVEITTPLVIKGVGWVKEKFVNMFFLKDIMVNMKIEEDE